MKIEVNPNFAKAFAVILPWTLVLPHVVSHRVAQLFNSDSHLQSLQSPFTASQYFAGPATIYHSGFLLVSHFLFLFSWNHVSTCLAG